MIFNLTVIQSAVHNVPIMALHFEPMRPTADTMLKASKISDAAYAGMMDAAPNQRSRLAISLRLLKRATDIKGKNIFDFGCGEGAFWRMLETEGARVLGCDPAPDLIARAPVMAAVAGVEWIEAMATASIDVLAVLNVLSYFEDVEDFPRFWKAANRIVRPGGLMLHCNPNRWAARDDGRYAFITDPAEFPKLLRMHGFDEIARDFYRWYPPYLPRLVAHLPERLQFDTRIHRPSLLALVPTVSKAQRSTGYFSLSRRVG